MSANANSAFQGDINQNCELNLQDVILGLQIITGLAPTIQEVVTDIDVDGDGRIGLVEAVYAIQAVGGLIDWTLPIITASSAGQIWMDRNLGACQVATSSIDPDAFGNLYQWGRLADGHESRTSSTTQELSATNVPDHGDFILRPVDYYDWRETPNDLLWQGVSGTNNPCPAGFRLPTDTELEIELISWGTDNNSTGAFGSPLKLVMAGYRDGWFGGILATDISGFYWSSTVDSDSSRSFFFVSDGAVIRTDDRVNGYSVRCIQD